MIGKIQTLIHHKSLRRNPQFVMIMAINTETLQCKASDLELKKDLECLEQTIIQKSTPTW